ncbi:rod shape-determining protein MreC [Verrucomicrobiota bacterium sgz303538]
MSRRANIFAVAGFAVALIGLMIFAANPQNVRRIQAGFLGLVSPFLKSGSSMERKYTAFREGLKTLEQLEQEAKQLRILNKELSATTQTLRGLEAENNRLRNALGYRERAVFQLMPARIIARDASTWYSTVTIDRGSAEMIEPDMPVLTEEGLVGKTTSTISEHSAVVVLISDENCKVAANVENTREQGIVRGERTSSSTMPSISLNFLSKQANLKPGQRIFTSGVGGVFPPGILIGAVKEFKVRELDGQATILPAVDLTTLQDVFVVVSDTK